MPISKADYAALVGLCAEALGAGVQRQERLQEALYLAEEIHEESDYANPVEEWIHRVENTLINEFGPGATVRE